MEDPLEDGMMEDWFLLRSINSISLMNIATGKRPGSTERAFLDLPQEIVPERSQFCGSL